MKICFINPPFKAEYGKFSRESRSPSIGHSGVLYYPLWLIYAAATAEKDGFDISFIDAPAKRLDEAKTLERVKNEAPDAALFVLDTSTPSIYSDASFGEILKKKYPKSKIMLVGTHPSAVPDETLNINDSIDIIARHEYDCIVRDTARAIRDGKGLDTVLGITYRENGSVMQTSDASYIEQLDEIPMAAPFIKKYLDVKDYVFPAASYPAIQIFTGRGCPAHCNYCVYPQTLHGHKYRLRTPENVVKEFKYIAQNFPEVHEIVIEDDTFTANKKRVLEICSLLIKNGLNKRFKWLCNARVNVDLETMQAMKKAGCHLIIPGFESYNEQILKNIKKGSNLKLIDAYVANAKKAGLMIHACYMVGNEGETRETMETTLAAAMRFKTDTAQFFPLIPYPGTEAYEWAKSNGYISGKYEDYLQNDGTLNCVLNTPELSAQELVDFCAYARKKYYMRPWYIAHRLWKGIRDPEDMKRSLKAFWRLKDSLLK
ncbi:MAG: radical SAM protein [Oscillospiraceae bacterium]|nr:radical SAM protein [Oscillospiraceae bacterium]